MSDIILKRYTPFFYSTKKSKTKGKELDADILDPYKVKDYSIDFSNSSWMEMRLLARWFDEKGIDDRVFPLLISAQSSISGSKIVKNQATNTEVRINYLATVVFGLIAASREILTSDKQQVSEYISGISNYLNSIIKMDRSLEDDVFALSAMIDSALYMLAEIAPNEYMEYQKQLQPEEIMIEDTPLNFNLLERTDISMEQEVFIYDSKIGFMVNQITIENIEKINQDTLYSMDLLFRLCQGGFAHSTEKDILDQCQKSLHSIKIESVEFSPNYFDVVAFDEAIEEENLAITSLLDNPLVELFDSDLRTNLFIIKLKQAKSLLAQADFRSSLKNQGSFRHKLPIFRSIGFLMLQIFHEETQTQRYLDIYTESWSKWYDELARAMNYSLAQVIAGGNRSLQDIYYEANRLELFFVQQFNDMSMSAKVSELSDTMNYHVYLTNRTGGATSILAKDLDKKTGSIRLDRLTNINDESSYMEYIDPKLFLNVLGDKLNLESNYNSFRELHANLEEILESVQEISQTKQQRVITIAIVIFSLTELTLAFLEVFGAIFGV